MLVTNMMIHMNTCLHKDCSDAPYTNFVKMDENKQLHLQLTVMPSVPPRYTILSDN